jgi:hypothetical protein
VTVYAGERLTRARAADRPRLTAAEQHIDVEAIDETLNRAKDLLDQAIQTEQARVAAAIADGHTPAWRSPRGWSRSCATCAPTAAPTP